MKHYTPYMMLIGLLIFSQNLYAVVFVAFFANPPQQPPLERNARFVHSAIYQMVNGSIPTLITMFESPQILLIQKQILF